MSAAARRANDGVKACLRCGRVITWRKKWARVWEQVQYCSDACRRARLTPLDLELEAVLLELLARRARGVSVCPSEAVRQFVSPEHPRWPDLCHRARRAACRLAGRGLVELTKAGAVADPSRTSGPVRVRLLRR